MPDATPAEMAELARAKGSVEVIAFEEDPAAPTRRTLVRLGERGFAYPGFSVSARKMLAEADVAGLLATASDGKTASAPFQQRGASGVVEWALPQTQDAPLCVTAKVAGKVAARTTIHPVADGSERRDLPLLIETVSPNRGVTIVQVFEYLDGPPALPESPDRAAAEPAKPRGIAGEQAGQATATDDVAFDASLTGLSWSWDTKWWPGENEEPGGFPVQIRLIMGAGADVASHVEGDFELDYNASQLQADAGSGDLAIDFGAEFSAQGSIDVGIWDPFVFDIPYVPQFDLRVYDEASFDSYLLDASVSVSDATGRQNVVNVDIVDLVLSGVIEIPGLGGGVSIDASLGASGEMTADSISVTDGNVYTNEGESRPVTIGVDGYQETASYNEDLEMTATLTAYPVLYIEFLWMRWDLPVFDLPWDIVTGQVDLDFSTSALDFPPRMYSLTINETNGGWGDVDLDPEPDDANLTAYRAGTAVALTALPIEGKSFRHWEVYDPNHPGDANYAAVDTNNPITIVMDTDREVTAVFKCGSGVGAALPLLVVGVLLMAMRRRR